MDDLISDAWKSFRELPEDTMHLSGIRVPLCHLKAIILKRFLQTVRDGSLISLQLLASILPVILTVIFVSGPKKSQPPSFPLTLGPKDGRQEVLIAVNSSPSVYDAQSLDIINTYKLFTLNRKIKVVDTGINGSLKFLEAYKSCDDNLQESYVLQCFKNISTNAFSILHRSGKIAVVFAGMGNKEKREFNIKMYYNEDAHQAAGISLNYISSAILHVQTRGKYTLSSFIHPINPTVIDKLNNLVTNRAGMFNVAKYLIGMCLMVSIWLPLLIRERVSKAKLILFLEGLHPFVYWYSNFLFDYSLYTMATAFYMAVSFIHTDPYYSFMNDAKHYAWLGILYLTFGFATIPFNYFCSSVLYKSKNAMVLNFFIQVVVGKFLTFS